MIPITEKQHQILMVIPSDVGIKYGEIQKLSGFENAYLSGSLQELLRKGLVIKEGKSRHYIFKSTGEPVTVKEGKVAVVSNPPKPDPYLDRVAAIELDDEQLLYLKNHRNEKRSVLARKLGLSKLEVNFALEKLGRVKA